MRSLAKIVSNSRGPDTLKELVDEMGSRARAATSAEAAAAGDLIVVTIPFKAYRQVPVEPLAGKTVIDTNNYYPQLDGQFPELDSESTSVSKLIQQHLPTSRVVKAFSNIFFGHLGSLGRPAGAADRSALPIAGDDAAAKTAVTEFLDRIVYDAVDAGALSENWRFRPHTPAYAVPYSGGREDVWAAAAHLVNAEQLRGLLAQADEQPGSTAGRLSEGY